MISLLVLALLISAESQKGPAELRIGYSVIKIPAGCEGDAVASIDAILGGVTCGTFKILVWGPPLDPCDPCGFDDRPQCQAKAASRGPTSVVTLEGGASLAICTAEWAKADVRLVAKPRESGLQFWSTPRNSRESALFFQVASSYRYVGPK